MACVISTDKAWENFINNNFKHIDQDETQISPNIGKPPKPSEIYISTQTKIAYINQKIDLMKVFWKIPVISYQDAKNGVIKKQIKVNSDSEIELQSLQEKINNEKMIIVDIISQINNPHARKIKFKDVRKINIGLCKKDLMCLRKKKKGAFYNCFVLILRVKYKEIFKEVHIKVFNTGKLEIPGIQEDPFLIVALDNLINILQPHVNEKLSYSEELINNVLINSNFSANYYINRQLFYDKLKYKYKIHAIYDPCSYPGIQCKFYYNKTNKKNNGICSCPNRCTKKGKGEGVNECLEVSFMIFRTGSVLIVGNCNVQILHIIYGYLIKVLHDEFCDIYINSTNMKKKVVKSKKVRKKNILIRK